jgi:hypothetical protein
VTDPKHEDKVLPAGAFMIPASNAWAHAWKMAAAIAVVGLVISVVGYMADPRRFAFSYLMGFWTVFTMALGTTFFVLLQHLTAAGWSVTVRRAAEFFSAGMIVIPILFIPNALNYETLLPWTSFYADEHVAHAQEHGGHDDHAGHDHAGHDHGADKAAHAGGHEAHGAAAAHAGGHGEHHSPEHALHAKITQSKFWYLSPTFLWIRAVITLVLVLPLIALFFFRNSTNQDKDGSPAWTVKSARSAPVATMLFALALTFPAFDWVMGLEPNWYSTMFGVRVFASSAVLGLALTMLMCLGFMRTGLVKNEINVEHIHDLGKLMFGFLVFWAYVSFCEFMLIWYAAIPEETAYFHRRWDYPSWQLISIAVVVVKFIMPFFLTMSRNVKRNLGVIGFAAGWIAALHLVEMYYWIMPYYAPDTDVPFSMMGMATDVGCILLCVGVYLAVVFKRMLNHPVIPVRDPRLQRSLDFVQV